MLWKAAAQSLRPVGKGWWAVGGGRPGVAEVDEDGDEALGGEGGAPADVDFVEGGEDDHAAAVEVEDGGDGVVGREICSAEDVH